jgi:hypothetical protein
MTTEYYHNPARTEAAEGHVMCLTQQLHAPERIAAPVVVQLRYLLSVYIKAQGSFFFFSYFLFLPVVLIELLVSFPTEQE